MIKKITVKRECYFCDHCGKKLDWADDENEYHENVYNITGIDGDYCADCEDTIWQCCECGNVFFTDDGNNYINIDDNYYCPACAKKFAEDILRQVAENG